MKNRSKHQMMTVGAPSLIMIFVVLCLTCFSALSMVSANADMRLSTRTAGNTAAYYAADAGAQHTLAAVYALLEGGAGAEELAEKGVTLSGGEVTFTTAITAYTALETRALHIPGKGMEIKANRVVVTGELEYTELPEIWDGNPEND